MNAQKLIDTAKMLVANNKGLLAIDESKPTCNKRFAKLGIPQNEECRRAYRELIITTVGLMEGAHTLEQCREVTEEVLRDRCSVSWWFNRCCWRA